MAKQQYSESKKPQLTESDIKSILAIAEGRNWKPVSKSGRFINANHPPEGVSQEKLERIWGDPEDTVSLRNENAPAYTKRQRASHFQNSKSSKIGGKNNEKAERN